VQQILTPLVTAKFTQQCNFLSIWHKLGWQLMMTNLQTDI